VRSIPDEKIEFSYLMHEINVLPIKLTRLVSIRTKCGNCKDALEKACTENGKIQIRKKFNKDSVHMNVYVLFDFILVIKTNFL
jgi:hypothetical protein